MFDIIEFETQCKIDCWMDGNIHNIKEKFHGEVVLNTMRYGRVRKYN